MRVDANTFIAWPLQNEAHLTKGYKLEFDVNNNWSLSRVTEIADLEAGTMRPTPVTVQEWEEGKVLFLATLSVFSIRWYNNYVAVHKLTRNKCI